MAGQSRTAYQRSDGLWVAPLELGVVGGKRKRRVFYGGTKAEAEAKRQAAMGRRAEGKALTQSTKPLAGYLDEWLRRASPTIAPTTAASYRWIVTKLLVPVVGHIRLADLTHENVQALIEALSVSYSPRTVQYAHAVLRRALGQAVKWRYVSENVAKLVDPPRQIRVEIQPLTVEQAKMLLHHAWQTPLYALYAVALAVGLRRGEALGLMWSDFAPESKSLHIRRSVVRVDGKLQIVSPKRGSRRMVILPEPCVSALLTHQVRQKKRGIESEYIFCNRDGGPIEPRNLNRQFYRLCEAAGLSGVRLHDLRHTCATLLLAQGVSPRVIMATLGHSSIQVTMNVYAHVMPAMQQEAAERLAHLFYEDGPSDAIEAAI